MKTTNNISSLPTAVSFLLKLRLWKLRLGPGLRVHSRSRCPRYLRSLPGSSPNRTAPKSPDRARVSKKTSEAFLSLQRLQCHAWGPEMPHTSNYTVVPQYLQGIGSRTPRIYRNPRILNSSTLRKMLRYLHITDTRHPIDFKSSLGRHA